MSGNDVSTNSTRSTPEARDVVVTGIGTVSAGGWSTEETWRTIREGRSCVADVKRFDLGDSLSRFAACVPGRESDLPAADSLLIEYGIHAAQEAIADAGLAHGAVDDAIVANHGDRRVPHGATDSRIARTDEVAEAVATSVGASGYVTSHGACAAGTMAIGMGAHLIRYGIADVVLAGATDSLINGYDYFQFCNLHAMSERDCEPTRASRPFDRDRDGYVMGEGAAFFVLESAEHAAARGARERARILGFGCSQNANHYITLPEDGGGPIRAMEAALADAEIDPSTVGYINAHGTSTPLNDRCETTAIHAVFGRSTEVLVSSTKSIIGHATAAAGAIEAMIAVRSLEDQVAPPTINLDHVDPDCDLNHVANVAAPMSATVAMSNSFGFGGHCASIVIGVGQ